MSYNLYETAMTHISGFFNYSIMMTNLKLEDKYNYAPNI